MEKSPEFQNPISYEQVQAETFDGLLIPGGHDKGVRVLLESAPIQRVAAYFFDHGKPVAAICHGLLLLARSRSAEDPERVRHSVLWGRKTTGLTRRQEILSYQLTRAWMGDHYRTYDTTVQDEVVSVLRSPSDFSTGPGFPIPSQRDSAANLRAGYTVLDGNYLSARWPGDVHKFSSDFLRLLTGNSQEGKQA
jgi:putative intracellular protease/amidase